MNTIQISDDGGDTVTVIEHNGHIWPPFRDTGGLQGLNSFNIRDDDIFICAYPKSGTHWIFEITRELLTGEITDDTVTKVSTFVESQEEEAFADMASPRILNTHALFEQLPADIVTKNIKIIHVLRNPKDVAVSFFNFLKSVPRFNYDGKWENFFRPYCQGKLVYTSWFDYEKTLEDFKKKHPQQPVLTVFYEDFKGDQTSEMRKLCQFLGVERSDEFLSKVIENTSLKKMRSQKPVGTKVFRKGEVADWKNWFTVAQNEWFDRLYQVEMKDYQLNFKFEPDETNFSN